MKIDPWIIGFISGLAAGYALARFWAFRQYFGIEDRIVEAIKKAGVVVHEGDNVYVSKKPNP
jgi:hypothetical protein